MDMNMHEKMPFYYQRTGPYADLPYHRHTIKTDGCGIVAFAMAASYLLERDVEPPELVKWAGRKFAGLSGITEEGRVLIHNPNGMNDGKDFPIETIGKFRARSISEKSFYNYRAFPAELPIRYISV